MTFNVGIWSRNWKLTDPNFWLERAKAMRKFLIEESPDIICFQELWFPHNLFIPKEYRKVCGTGWEHPIYVKKGIKVTNPSFHIYYSKCNINGVDIFNIHGHWDIKRTTKLCKQLREIYLWSGKPTILTGDFNNDTDILEQYLPAVTRTSIPDVTYKHFKSGRTACIDHFYTVFIKYKSTTIKYYDDVVISDHYPMILEYEKV